MKFMLFVLPTVPATLEDRKRLRPIGRESRFRTRKASGGGRSPNGPAPTAPPARSTNKA